MIQTNAMETSYLQLPAVNVASQRPLLITVGNAHSREFVCVFCFVSCKTSQKVNISQQLTWSKIKVSKQPPLWQQSGRSIKLLFFLLSARWSYFAAVKINDAVGKRIRKDSKIRHVARNEYYYIALSYKDWELPN